MSVTVLFVGFTIGLLPFPLLPLASGFIGKYPPLESDEPPPPPPHATVNVPMIRRHKNRQVNFSSFFVEP